MGGGFLLRAGGFPSVVTLGLGPRVQDNDSLFGGASRVGKAEFMLLDPRFRKHDGLPPLCHARPRSGIQCNESLFWRGVKG